MKIATKIALSAIVLGTGLLSLAQSSAQPPIYRCAGEDGLIYTDRPCEGGAEPHEIDGSRVTVYTPAPVAERASAAAPIKQPKKAKRARSGRTADPGQQRAKCARLEQGLRDVRTKMRSGYGVREGERLKTRQRQLNQQRRAQKCR
jgi:hypothetical protein